MVAGVAPSQSSTRRQIQSKKQGDPASQKKRTNKTDRKGTVGLLLSPGADEQSGHRTAAGGKDQGDAVQHINNGVYDVDGSQRVGANIGGDKNAVHNGI